MDADSARTLALLAKQNGVHLACAPCSLLSNSAQTVMHALRNGAIGRVRLVYAEFDDGMIAPQMSPWNWRNSFGVNWPAKDEFEVGCTFEHAGYVLTWLGAFFGPAQGVTAFASCQIPNKGISVDVMAPDFTVGCIEYKDGVVARVTCSLVAPKDKSITIIGDKGILSVADVRNDLCPVYLQPTPAQGWRAGVARRINRLRKLLRVPGAEKEWHIRQRLPLITSRNGKLFDPHKPVDFCRGPAELAASIRENRPCRLSAEFAVHIVELVEALQHPQRFGNHRQITTNFAPIRPVQTGN
jgi:predicted dehydrogenase